MNARRYYPNNTVRPREVSYKRGPYAKRQRVERIMHTYLEHYEVEHCIMYDPNNNEYYVKLVDYDAVVFFGETYHSDVKFDTLGDARAFLEYLVGVLGEC